MSTEDIVTFEQAKKLAELGFDYKVHLYYQLRDKELLENVRKDYNWKARNNIERCTIVSCPTLSQAQKWLRDVKSIFVQSSLIRQQSHDKKHDWLIYDKDGKCIALVIVVMVVMKLRFQQELIKHLSF